MDNVYANFVYALVGVILYNVKSKHANYLKVLSGLYLILFLGDIIYQDVDEAAAKAMWFFVSFSILTISILRVRSKEKITAFELIKILAAMLILTMPITFYDIAGLWGKQWVIVLHTSIVPILFSIYVYDRFILNYDEVGNRTLTMLIIQTIMIIGLLVYAFDKSTQMEFKKIEHKDALYKKDLEIDRLQNDLEDCLEESITSTSN
ncbi:hypothetical protein [Fulvivirga lutea]|uniref:Uncharacterized protein n=1 Tax=Fulvivirga lutea TaxID=2810512 RepID=A0A974WP47_9BACT|nr:hypothetical protein [Fulvivirga lutea]QSE99063.1 hypothetical protein JR347_08245 [Fulvivirga lutea]